MSIFNPGAGKILSVFIFDGVGIVLTLLIAQFLLVAPQTMLFTVAWVVSSLMSLYLAGRFSEKRRKLSAHLSRICLGLTIAIILCYPFLSGVDKNRVVFLISLYFLSVFWLMLNTLVDLRLNLFKQSSDTKVLAFLQSDEAKHRLEDVRLKLNVYGYKVEYRSIENDWDQIDKEADQFDILVYENQVPMQYKKFAAQLLKKKIKGKKIYDFLSFYAGITGRIPLEMTSESVLLEGGKGYFENKFLLRFMRLIDLVGGISIALVAFVPALLITILIKLESPGKVIFQQDRLGKNMQPFTLYKFRSMRLDAEKDGPQWASTQDSRVTTIGAFLRKTHLDELPQIINLIKGDISLVGPRPIRKFFADQLMESIPYYHLRFLVTPGLTGWAQLKGPYGANHEEQRIKHEMDIYYILNATLPLNLYLIFATSGKITGNSPQW